MDTTHRWPASALTAVSVLAVAAIAGWYDVSVQSQSRSAAAHTLETQLTGLEARTAALGQDLSHANAQAQAFAVQAKNARTELQAAQQQTAMLASRLADAQVHEKHALADADLRIDKLKSAITEHKFTAAEPKPQGANNIMAALVRSDVAPVLPLPGLPLGATWRDYLVAAQQSIRAGYLGKAQACMERAEVRMLNDENLAQPSHTHPHEVAVVQRALDQLRAKNRHGALMTVDNLLSKES